MLIHNLFILPPCCINRRESEIDFESLDDQNFLFLYRLDHLSFVPTDAISPSLSSRVEGRRHRRHEQTSRFTTFIRFRTSVQGQSRSVNPDLYKYFKDFLSLLLDVVRRFGRQDKIQIDKKKRKHALDAMLLSLHFLSLSKLGYHVSGR